MSLNLGLTRVESEETPIELSDVLLAELEFANAYQDFLNYKNTCEIVIKAKSSTERLAFAQDLLGVSVESIEVSVEKLGTALRRAWEKFVGWLNSAVRYIKYNIIKHAFKKDGEFEVTVCTREHLKESIAAYEKMIKFIDEGKAIPREMKFDEKETNEEKITTRAALVEWMRLADKMVYTANRMVKRIDEADKDDRYYILGVKVGMSLMKAYIPAIINEVRKQKQKNEKNKTA